MPARPARRHASIRPRDSETPAERSPSTAIFVALNPGQAGEARAQLAALRMRASSRAANASKFGSRRLSASCHASATIPLWGLLEARTAVLVDSLRVGGSLTALFGPLRRAGGIDR